MITISEEILLLLLDYDSGVTNGSIAPHSGANAVSGGILMDLALEGRIDTDPDTLFMIDPEPVGEPALDNALSQIAVDNRHRTIDYWVDTFAADSERAQTQLVDRLISRGILFRGPYDRLWVMGTRNYVQEDGLPLRDVRRRIAGVLLSGELPDSRDVMIISLADACRLWRGLIDEDSQDALAPRIGQIARMDFIGQAVVRSIREHEDSEESVH